MARILSDLPNTVAPGGDYPNGRLRDRAGSTPGTPLSEETLGDMFQFFAKLMSLVDITSNGNPDNKADGYQLISALKYMVNKTGAMWTARSAAEANGWRSVTYGDGLFVAVASSGTNRVMTSPDGINWTARSAAEANSWRSVTYGDGLFVAVAFDGTNRVMTSPDGINWTARSAAEANGWIYITYGNGLFVAVSGDGTNRVMTTY